MDMTFDQVVAQTFFEPDHYLSQKQLALICQIQMGEISQEDGKEALDNLRKVAGRMNTAYKNIVKIRNKHTTHPSPTSAKEVMKIDELVTELYNGILEPSLFCDYIKLCMKRLNTYEKSVSTSVKTEGSGVVLSYDKLIERKRFCFPDYQVVLRMLHHDIQYKEQQWPVEQRDIVFDVQLMKIKGEVTNTLRRIYTEEKSQAEALHLFVSNKLYMYKVHTTESIPNGGAVVGYIELRVIDRKLKNRITVDNKAMKVNSMDGAEVEKRIRAGMKEAKALLLRNQALKENIQYKRLDREKNYLVNNRREVRHSN